MPPSPSLRLNNHIALVTGGGSGIGRAAALAYAREGAKVAVAGRRAKEIEETVHLITMDGGEAYAIPADVSVAEEVKTLIAAVVERYGRLDVAFNNAGVEGRFAPITELTEADFDHVVSVNLKGVWLSIKYEVEAMLAQGSGVIVNTSSFLARGAVAGSSAYSASKGALEAMIRAVALECGPSGIRINNVLPGAIDTPMFGRLGGDDVRTPLEAYTPLRRVGQPADVGDVAVWLSTDEARFVTGQSLLVDGGLTIPGMR
ncbi:MAG TPA: glucose 1-dehydrogenase [Microvirga sp.]|jgi:NAD(P)-dependent dehydrogenase (short-subunit alcohol dehydrogenase family)|nr:glucose 1-dehydrogenase [Microvirga sp.]